MSKQSHTAAQKAPVRWGMVGYGAVTEHKSGPAFARAEGGTLQAVAGRDVSRARDYAGRHGVPEVMADIPALIESERVDAVYIATPPSSHLEIALMVARAGKPCCVEKPLALNTAECEAMVQAFGSQQIPLFVSYYRRALPRFLKVREWLSSGRIGTVRHVHWQLSRSVHPRDTAPQPPWRLQAEIGGAGYFYDIGSHGLDLLRFLLGPVEWASGEASNQAGHYRVPDAVVGSWRHASGATGSGAWHFAADQRRDWVQIVGERGQIGFSVLDEQPIECTDPRGTERLDIAHPTPVQLPHVAALNQHLLGGAAHSATGAEGLACNRLMQQLLGDGFTI